MRKLLLAMLALALTSAYAMEGNVLWIEKKDMDTKAWLTVNETLWYIPINSGESFEIEYDIYIDEYQSNIKDDYRIWDSIKILQKPLRMLKTYKKILTIV